ncbi:MAG: PcfJ domain-containing protein [Marinifilaceae bacterium]
MKPRNKYERRIVALSATLPELTEKQITYAHRHVFEAVAYRNKEDYNCLCCGGHWIETRGELLDSFTKIKCPHCQRELKVKRTRKKSESEGAFFAIFDVRENIQIVRFFEFRRYWRNGEVDYHHFEIVQHWYNGIKTSYIARNKNMSGNSFVWGSEMSIKDESPYAYSISYDLHAHALYPYGRITKELKRNGLKFKLHGFNPKTVIMRLQTSSKFETLWKAKQYEMCDMSLSDMDRFWPSIKICLRNKYRVKDASIWVDEMGLLERAGKDMRNPKYVCPKNLIATHNRRVAIARKKEAERRRLLEIKHKEELIERDKKAAKVFEQAKSKFFGLLIEVDDIKIEPLRSIEEFKKESDVMKHCVYTGRYFEKQTSLILSAHTEVEKIETIEVDLEQMVVKQCRGVRNSNTEYHNLIVDAVNRNMHKIKQLAI